MFGGKKDRMEDDRLDRLGQEILRAAAMSEDDVASADSSPFLLARIRAQIAAEKERREAASDQWLLIFPAFRRAVPVMILVALSAVGASWYLQPVAPVEPSREVDLLYPDPHDRRLAAVSACAISNKDECAISTEEVLATLVSEERQEAQ